MQALGATSEECKSGRVAQVELVPYAGPQCYPQLKERLMANAVEEGGLRRRGVERGVDGREVWGQDKRSGRIGRLRQGYVGATCTQKVTPVRVSGQGESGVSSEEKIFVISECGLWHRGL